MGTQIYGMIDRYRSSDLGKAYRIKLGESHQPYARSKQVGAVLVTQTYENVHTHWERIAHILGVYEWGQNVGAYGTEYFGKFRTFKDAKKALLKFWKKFEKLRNDSIDCPFSYNRLSYKVCGVSWGRAIRKYQAGYKTARNTRYPYSLRPFMHMGDWETLLN